MMASTREIVEEPPPPSPVHVVEDKVYVAVGTDLKESKSVITWALRHSGGRKICILHVHEPAQRIPCMLGAKFAVSPLEEHQVRAHRQVKRQEMNKLLRDYCTLCSSAGVHAEVVHMEMNSIEKGILELIKEHGITKLVMGAAANKHYSKKMMQPKSKKAIFVRQQAPMSCKIWFICKGNLVHTREGRSEGVSMDVASSTLQAGPNTETRQSTSSTLQAGPNTETRQSAAWRSQSIAEGANDQLRLTNSGQNYHRALSALPGIRVSTFSSDRSSGLTPRSSSIAERSSADWDEPCNSHYSSRSSDDMADVSALTLVLTKEDHHQFSSPPSVLEGRMSAELYDQFEQSMAEAENSRREAFDQSRRRRKAEKDAIDAIHRAKASERLYAEEVRQRKEVEEALARVKEELRKMKQQVAEVAEELYIAVEHKSSLESQIANSNLMVKDLEQKLFSAEKLLQKYKKERDELQAERDNALKEAEELRKEQAETSANTLGPEFFSQFSFSEIKEATSSFDLSLKIGEGGYGNIYKGLLRHTEVAIKMLHTNSKQGPSEYQQEAKASENLHGEELRQTKEVGEMVKDLEQKMFSAVQLSQKYNHMERDELQMECNNVLKEEKGLRKEQAEVVVYTPAPVFFSEFSYSEIVQATSSFNQSLMIGQGRCGDIYKGLLRHIQLAIKMLHSNSLQGPLEFQQEAVMEELIKMAKISYKSFTLAEKNTAQQFFKELNRDYDGKVSCHEFLGFIRDKGLAKMGSHHFFQTLDRDGSEILDFVQAMALYCMIQSGRPFCYGCDEFIPGMYFTCSSCHQSGKNVCCPCPQCFENGTHCHEHDQFFDNYDMLEVQRMKGLDTHWKQQHQNWAKKKGNSLRDEIPFEVSSISMDEKLDSRLQFMHMSQFDRSSPRPLALPDGGGIVGSIASSVSEVATTSNRAHLVGQDQCGSTVSHYEIRNNRETSGKQGLTMSLSCVEDHLQAFGCKHKDDVKSLCGNLLSAIYLFFLPIESFWVYWRPCQFENNERQAFDATNNRANIIKADECGPTASNSDKGSTRKALKRARLSNVLSVEDLQQHFGARCKDAAKGLGDSIARKSVKVGDIPLGAQSNSIIFLVRRRTLTHKHCVRLKKSQDLQRSLRMDCSGGLSSQSAIGLPDGRHILSLSVKKIVRKTLKRKCRTMCVHILEDHRQHVHRRWENAAKASTTKHNSRQLVMHGVSIAKRICRQHGINQWPFQKHYATRKQYSLGDERSVEVTSLATDGNLVSRLQLIHISWLGRFSPWRSTLPAIALLSSEFVATINGANFVEQDQSGSTASHSGKKIIRQTENGEWINSSISLENLQQLFGSKRKNAAESLSVSESTFKRICRQHGIERWPSQRGSRERQGFDATNNRANIIKADEHSPTASNSDKESTRKAFKRARLSNVLSVEDLQQHFGARCKDAAKGLGDSIAWKSVKVLDSPLGAQSNNIIFSVRRRALTHKHCVRLKKSQDLQRSLRMDCSGGLSSQSAIGLPDGRHVPSLLEKKIVRKTLKRKCRTMCVHILEDHRHLDRRWENAAKASTTKHNCWQLVMHGVSTAKRIRRQHGINQWPFQRHFATRKRYSLGDERSVEATSLATDGKLVSRLQLIHISWLGRFSPRRSTLPAIALLSSEFAAKINGANFVERDQSGSTASHSGKKIIRRTANGEWINSSISLENLQQLFGSKRKDAAERLGVSESTFKRICRQHGIERWPSQRGSQVLKPPDPAERNESTTCKALSTHGQIEIENEMVGQLHEPNEFPPDFFDGLPCWNTENGILFPQPQVASTQMSSGNMGSSGDCRNLLVSQAEPSLEGHGSEAIYWTMPPCSDLASSQQTPTIPYTMLSIPHTTPPLTIQQDMRSLTIKAIYGDTIIKFKLPLSSGIIGLKEEVSKRLKFELDSFQVKYKDECGDLILIACDEDLRDCLELFNLSGNQEIRLLVFDRFANTTNFCKNCRSLKRKRA